MTCSGSQGGDMILDCSTWANNTISPESCSFRGRNRPLYRKSTIGPVMGRDADDR